MARGVPMTVDEIAAQLRAAGVDENVIAQEAATIAANYADPDEDPQAVLDQVMPLYLQRSQSAGNREIGGYSTDLNDPAANYGGVTAPERQAEGGNWFANNAPLPEEFGFSEQYTAPTRTYGDYALPERPEALRQAYAPEAWREEFREPTMADLEADPGYLASEAAMRRGMERSAAARGSVLSGGFVGRTMPRALAENTQTAYQNLRGRAFDAYRQRYGQFMDSQNLAGQARGINEAAYQGDVTNSLNAYQTRENAYQNTVGNSLNQYLARRNAYQDAVNNNLNFSRLGLDATMAGRP